MDWYTKIWDWHTTGIWTTEMVQNAVEKGKITQKQCDTILAG